ncbi:MAG: DUF4373 domain-containing protein [Butyrivibrio sp.]|nr:DUF4373 domain-containing protein [Acetatifactor muris]MCM1561459.1 DUF4373 domain-containing protein [Butyrivibrio sp.]
MAGRGNKVNLDYFELDCHMDEKVKFIRAEFGLKGFAVVVMMYQYIYGGDHGYYCEWDYDRLLLFMSDNGLIGESKNLIDEIVHACIRRNLFSERLFKKYGILTSSGVQKQYLKATAKREAVELKKEYLLIKIPKKRTNVVINSISDGRNAISDARNAQSRVEKSIKENKNIMCETDALFERLWQIYPVKKGKGQVSDAKKRKLLEIGFDEMSRAVERYLAELKKDSWRKPQNGSTFFNSGYIDYLDANFVPDSQKGREPPSRKGTFNNFRQNDYDFGRLEEELRSN